MTRQRSHKCNPNDIATIALAVSGIILIIPVELLRNLSSGTSPPTQHHGIAIAGVLLIITLIYVVSRFKIHVGRETGSPALEADGYHSRVDMLTSVAVLVALVGDMVGLRLEQLVTVLIAVMIGLTGIELAVSALVAIARGQDIEEFSVVSAGARVLAIVTKRSPRELWEDHRGQLLVLGSLLLTGFLWASSARFVDIGQQGFVYRLGALQPDRLATGWHLRWPYPFEEVKLENSRTSLEISFDPNEADTSLVTTADNALLDLKVRLHVHQKDQTAVVVKGLYVTQALPPQAVIDAFRDFLSADQERQELLHQALLYRNEKIPAARAEAERRYLEATAESRSQVLRTQGMVNLLSPQMAAFQRAPDITEKRLRLENTELALTGRKLVVADAEVNRGDYRRY